MNDPANVARARFVSRTDAAAPQDTAQGEAQNDQGNAAQQQAPAATPAPATKSVAAQKRQKNLQSQAQLRSFMQQTQIQFNQMLTCQGPGRKKDPPTLNENLDLFIHSTDVYYAYKRGVKHTESSEFVEEITCNLGKCVQSWCRTICTAAGVKKTWRLFKEKMRQRFKPKDFE
ncbi:hypothetical protein PsorP6_005162 [Peronosclerospora sorghi]|uniref:Uncharacterized protein n=1 Tax=Peronosclerospora sorghi TaxID=230839 RepID=A0ACC0W1S7_9STRA|nr:hypothetical protein PsorP6_005162 [Peronosclerospora sorghi]